MADGHTQTAQTAKAPAPNWLIKRFGPADPDGTWQGMTLADMIHDFGAVEEEDEDYGDMTLRERLGYGRPFDARREWGTW